MKIVIPTLGRVNKQVTYNSLPDKWKKEVNFVVQSHEYEEMKSIYGDQVLMLPEKIQKIAPTREWIQEQFRNDRYWVFDDDLEFKIRNYNADGKPATWLQVGMTDEEFDEMIQHAHDFMDKGYSHGGAAPIWYPPTAKEDLYPFRTNFRQCTNCFFDGPNLPTIEWDRCQATEDFDAILQLLTKGIPNAVFMKYIVKCSETNSDGGCSAWRTIEYHNESQKKFQSLWPEYVNLKEKTVSSGPWKGQIKLNVNVAWKRAYNDGVKNHIEPSNSLSEFMA
jgi:hypothetical protein